MEKNSFILPELDHRTPVSEQDRLDAMNLYDILENKVMPIFYDHPKKWQKIVFNGIDDVLSDFSSHRMADQYYKELFK
jgi:starch phosphorylase